MMTPTDIAAMRADAEQGTPGPWKFCHDDDPSGIDIWHINDRDGNDFMGDRTFYPYQSKNEADARNIARVPDMIATIIAQAAEIERLKEMLTVQWEGTPWRDGPPPAEWRDGRLALVMRDDCAFIVEWDDDFEWLSEPTWFGDEEITHHAVFDKPTA